MEQPGSKFEPGSLFPCPQKYNWYSTHKFNQHCLKSNKSVGQFLYMTSAIFIRFGLKWIQKKCRKLRYDKTGFRLLYEIAHLTTQPKDRVPIPVKDKVSDADLSGWLDLSDSFFVLLLNNIGFRSNWFNGNKSKSKSWQIKR